MESEIDAHTLLHFPLHREMWCTLQGDIHRKASTERMQGDTDLRFCTYTCTELTHVPLCCHFATCYSFPGKKSVPELNDQPMYLMILMFLLLVSYLDISVQSFDMLTYG